MKDFSEATSTLKTTPGNLANKAFVCWTRMQAEAGQSLESIIARKEQERQFGAGVFFWGVGTPPSTLIKPLSRIGYPVSVIFSQMKSKPKKADANPESTLIWRSYFENDGKVVDLPPHALITSHGGTKSRPKRTHYALVCSSAQQLRLNWEIPFHPGSFRNASGLQRGVGASQVTALLEPTNFTEPKSSSYFANFTANLTGCYWVKLANPKKLDLSELATLNMLGPNQTRRGWTDVVTELRSGDFQKPSVSNLQSEIQFWSERV